MRWEKKICIRITTRRLAGGLLVASILVNLAIVGAVFGATDLTPFSTSTPPSETGLAASATNTPTPPAPGSETLLPSPSQTPSPTDAQTKTPTGTFTAMPTVHLCSLTSSWPLYTVRPGDTLFSLARASGSSVEALMAANCLQDVQIYPGQGLYLPRLPYVPPTPTATPSTSPTPTDTPSMTSTPTDFPRATPTPTATLDVRITFLRAVAELDMCPSTPENLFVSVTPESALGIASVTALFSIDRVPTGQMDLSQDGATYSGSTQVSPEKYPGITLLTYSFVAFDSQGNQAESGPYIGRIICSPGLAQ